MSMRLGRIVLPLGGALVVALALPANAINGYNAAPAPERTETGAMLVLWDRDGDGAPERLSIACTGAMVDDDTFLSAAHCVTDWSPDPADDSFYVTLEEQAQALLDESGLDRTTDGVALAALLVANGDAVQGDPAHDARFGHDQADGHDIAVIDFADRPVNPADVWTFTAATLPTAGQLDVLGGRTLDTLPWTVVGYGTQEATREPGGHVHLGGGTRLQANIGFDALNKAWIRLSMVESQGWGGACYGDSGGPNFVAIGGQLVLAGTTITGDTPCYATNVAYRTDTPSARAFLAPYVDLP
jgi:hypothetical protein